MAVLFLLFACIQTDLYEERSDELDSCPDSGIEAE